MAHFYSIAVLSAFLLVSCVAGIDLTSQQTLGMMSISGASTTPQVQWGTNATHIELQLSYPSLGWIALGISPTGGMDQSDVLFGYVDDKTGDVVIQDRYLLADMVIGVNLTLDTQQDWVKVSGSQNVTHTILRAVRKLRTCDAVDRPFTTGSMQMIFSFNPRDPESPTGSIQKHTQRGTININFLQTVNAFVPMERVVQQLNFTMDNFQVPGLDTTEYMCRLVKLPPFPVKLQAISQQPIIDPRSADLIHHILVSTCMTMPDSIDISKPLACGPKSGMQIMKLCPTTIGGWAVGGQGMIYPPEAGLPFTSDMGGSYVMIQVHYNNPNLKKPIDSSGISFLLTDQLRKFDVGTFTTGMLNNDDRLTIPPGQDAFTVTAQCSDQCTSVIPFGGVTFFSSAIHMHTRGRVGIARHFRGTQELPPLINNQNYDFNYQTRSQITPTRTFLPGDRIVIECTFSTTAENAAVFGGEATGNEMCLGFFDYYPKINMTVCGAFYTLPGYVNAIGYPASQVLSAGIGKNSNSTVLDALSNLSKPDTATLMPQLDAYVMTKKWKYTDVKKLQDFYRSKNYIGICNQFLGNYTVVMNDTPPFIPPFQDMADYMC